MFFLVPYLIVNLSRILELGWGNPGTKEENTPRGAAYSVGVGGSVSGRLVGTHPHPPSPPPAQGLAHPAPFLDWCRPDEPSLPALLSWVPVPTSSR